MSLYSWIRHVGADLKSRVSLPWIVLMEAMMKKSLRMSLRKKRSGLLQILPSFQPACGQERGEGVGFVSYHA